MGRLRVLSGREVCAILERHGFVAVRQRSSHVIMQRSIIGATTTVPVPDHKEIKVGTLPSIIRQSGCRAVSSSLKSWLDEIFWENVG